MRTVLIELWESSRQTPGANEAQRNEVQRQYKGSCPNEGNGSEKNMTSYKVPEGQCSSKHPFGETSNQCLVLHCLGVDFANGAVKSPFYLAWFQNANEKPIMRYAAVTTIAPEATKTAACLF